MKLKFTKKDEDVLKQVEREQSEVIYNRMLQYLTELSMSHPETEMANKESKKELKLLHDSGVNFKLFIEDDRNTYYGYINDKKVYEMYTIANGKELVELGCIRLIEDKEETYSEYTILSGLDKGDAKLWLGNYDYNYFEKGENDYSLR